MYQLLCPSNIVLICQIEHKGCTPPKTSRPALLCKLAVFSTQMLTKKLKNSLVLLIFRGGCADLMPFSVKKKTKQNKTKHFYQELRDLGAFYFVSSTAIQDYRVLKACKMNVQVLVQSSKNRAGNHPQNGFLSDGYEHNLSG